MPEVTLDQEFFTRSLDQALMEATQRVVFLNGVVMQRDAEVAALRQALEATLAQLSARQPPEPAPVAEEPPAPPTPVRSRRAKRPAGSTVKRPPGP